MTSAVRPSNFSRVSMQMQTSLLLNGIRKNSVDLLKVQNQLTTGLKLSRPSDGPTDATMVMHLDNLIERQQQYLSNINYSIDFLDTTDTALSQTVDLVTQAHELALDSIGANTDDDGRRANAQIIDQIIEQIVTISNFTSRGNYIFAGQNSDQPPFAAYENGVLFTGSRAVLQTRVADNNIIDFSVDGNDTFGALSSQIRGIADLDPDITNDTLVSDLNGASGQGVRLGSVVIRDQGNGTADTIDLSNCVTIADVINTINNNTDNTSASAAIGADGTSLQIFSVVGGADLLVTDLGSGTTARDLGIYDATGGDAFVLGQDVDARLTPNTPLTALKGGAGIDTNSGLHITNSLIPDIGPLDISNAQTLGDIINIINQAGIGVHAELNDDSTGINVVNQLSGSQMSVGENGGTTASDLGIRSLTSSTLLAELNGGNGVATTNDDGDGIIRITDRQGTSYDVNLSSATTIQDVIDLINTATGGNVTAALTATGNGIELTNTVGGAGSLSVTTVSENGFFVAEQLGLEQSVASDNLTGVDVNPVMPDGLFSHLIALRDAMLNNDDAAIAAADVALEIDRKNLSRVHGIVGAQTRAIEDRQLHMEDNILASETLRSGIRDIDFSEAITRYQNIYTALQANMMTGGQLSNMSLLDFLT